MKPTRTLPGASLGTGLVLTLALGFAPGCTKLPPLSLGTPTCGTLEVLHPGVTVRATGSASQGALREARVEAGGGVVTTAEGRAVVRTDDGLELRLAGDTEVTFPEGHPQVMRGRVFVSGWGDDERTVRVGDAARLHVGDAALEIERDDRGTRVIAVRGEASYQLQGRQGQVAQGEMLEGRDSLRLRPAGVWDDWTGGAASPRGVAHRGVQGAGRMEAHLDPGEAPSPLAINEHRVTVRLDGDAALTTVEQRFFNGSDRVAPVEYRLRLPTEAILSGFAVERSGTWSSGAPGTVASYAAGSGLPALLGTPTGEVYAQLGSLAPGETVATRVTYVEWLTHRDGLRTYTYPLADPVGAQLVGEFSLDLDATRARAGRVRAPEGARLVHSHILFRRSDFRPRGDVVVDLEDAIPITTPSARAWRSDLRNEDHTGYLMVDLSLPAPAPRGTDVAVVLDDSAATDPGALEIARASLDALLHQLGPGDRVALFLGDLGARPASGTAGRMEAVTPSRREAILDAVAHARPGGASDLGRMLVDAQSALDARRNGAVLYLGDATPTVGALDPERLVDEVSRQAPELRLYVLALGTRSHPEVLEPLTVRGGLTARVADQAEAVAETHRLTAHALRPCLRDVEVRVGNAVAHPLPSRVETWVAGEPLRVLGELTGRAPREVTVEARDGANRRRWVLPLRVEDAKDSGDLARRWAHARIRALAGTGSGRASIAALGRRFGLVTPVSGLVLGVAPGTVSESGYYVNTSAWPEDPIGSQLPTLGIGTTLGPRHVQSLGTLPEVPIAVDDESGWRPHALGEGAGRGSAALLNAALGAVEPAARACVERKRALRPGLSGSVVLTATIAADGRVTAASVSSTLGDGETEACIRRAALSLVLPPPSVLGAPPGTATRTLEFGAASSVASGSCPATARLPRATRRVLWRERFAVQGASAHAAVQVWTTAMSRCELRWWEDRVALLDLILDTLSDPTELVPLRNVLSDAGARDYLDAAMARRYGSSRVWRALGLDVTFVDWDALLRRLNAPEMTLDQKVTLLRAYLVLAPRDVDLRLRLMSVLEQGERTREARALAESLRRDPLSDARVRGLVGELFYRAGDRDEALRAFSEIAEAAPYDPYARGKLGDLLLTYGWAEEAYHQYETLAALRPGDPLPPVRLALAALVAGREDEALRTLRRAAEEAGSGADATGRVVESMLSAEVTRLALARPNDGAVRSWARAARQLQRDREAAMLVRWTHPDVGLELLARAPGDTAFTAVGESPAALGVRSWTPDAALEGTRLIARAAVGLQGRRALDARLQLLLWGAQDERLVEAALRFDAAHRAYGFVVRGGALVPEPVEPEQVPALAETMY